MNILAVLKMVPDVVEELEVAADGKALDAEYLRMILSERDNHALEQALLLKEKYGGSLTVLGLEAPDIDDVLFTALAKGADRAVKIVDLPAGLTTRAAAHVVAQAVSTVPGLWPSDLLLTGVQAIDDLDGQTAPLLSHLLGLPYLGIVTRVQADAAVSRLTVVKEYAGGVRGEFELPLPAVLGIQAAEKPPRYVPVAKVRAAMKSQRIESVPAPAASPPALVQVLQMAKPEASQQTEILYGSLEEMVGKVAEILAARGLLG